MQIVWKRQKILCWLSCTRVGINSFNRVTDPCYKRQFWCRFWPTIYIKGAFSFYLWYFFWSLYMLSQKAKRRPRASLRMRQLPGKELWVEHSFAHVVSVGLFSMTCPKYTWSHTHHELCTQSETISGLLFFLSVQL